MANPFPASLFPAEPFTKKGYIRLPSKAGDTFGFRLHWNYHTVASDWEQTPEYFLSVCQHTLAANFPIGNNLAIETAPSTFLPSDLTAVPALASPGTSSEPLRGGYQKGKFEHRKIERTINLAAREEQQQLNKADLMLAQGVAETGIACHLLGETSSSLNHLTTEFMLRYAQRTGEIPLADAFAKSATGQYGNPPDNERGFNHGTKIMTHPDHYQAVCHQLGYPLEGQSSSLGDSKIILNWDMPDRHAEEAHLLVGDFKQILLLLHPVKIAVTAHQQGWELMAATQVGMGMWDLSKGKIIKVPLANA